MSSLPCSRAAERNTGLAADLAAELTIAADLAAELAEANCVLSSRHSSAINILAHKGTKHARLTLRVLSSRHRFSSALFDSACTQRPRLSPTRCVQRTPRSDLAVVHTPF